MYSRARSSAASRPARKPSTVTTPGSSGATPLPANSDPSGNASRVTHNGKLQPFGKEMDKACPVLPAEAAPTIGPRAALRKATRKSSAAPDVRDEERDRKSTRLNSSH